MTHTASYYDTDLFNGNNGYISIEPLAPGSERLPADAADPNDLAAGCVPWNIWQDGGVTHGRRPTTSSRSALPKARPRRRSRSANMTGDLGVYGLQLPTAEEGIGVAFGAEYRRDTFGFLPDQTLGSGDLSGSGGASPTINADTDVTELYAEFRVPLLQGVTGAQDLVFETGYRYSDYELSGGVDTYKFGLQWAPIESVRLRGSFNHAIRAPSLIELFNPQTVTNTSVFSVDPCAGREPDDEPGGVPAHRRNRGPVRQHPAVPGGPVRGPDRRQSAGRARDCRHDHLRLHAQPDGAPGTDGEPRLV